MNMENYTVQRSGNDEENKHFYHSDSRGVVPLK